MVKFLAEKKGVDPLQVRFVIIIIIIIVMIIIIIMIIIIFYSY